jgi:hypothetical protein
MIVVFSPISAMHLFFVLVNSPIRFPMPEFKINALILFPLLFDKIHKRFFVLDRSCGRSAQIAS